MRRIALLAMLTAVLVANHCQAADEATGKSDDAPGKSEGPALKFEMSTLDGKKVDLAEKYAGKVVLLVNVASKCGYTPQYAALQELHEKYAEKGLAVVGVPCNQFGGQEPGTADEIQEFCSENYGVTFDLTEKVDVNGEKSCGLYKFLTSEETNKEFAGPIKWNFEKFLIDRQGNVVARYASRVKPESEEMVKAIEARLAKPE
ncbi:MAG: glutathione peroxidase [Pirellulales bacterium]